MAKIINLFATANLGHCTFVSSAKKKSNTEHSAIKTNAPTGKGLGPRGSY